MALIQHSWPCGRKEFLGREQMFMSRQAAAPADDLDHLPALSVLPEVVRRQIPSEVRKSIPRWGLASS